MHKYTKKYGHTYHIMRATKKCLIYTSKNIYRYKNHWPTTRKDKSSKDTGDHPHKWVLFLVHTSSQNKGT